MLHRQLSLPHLQQPKPRIQLLGKSQIVVTSYTTKAAKPMLIVESGESEDSDENHIYPPSLPTNGLKDDDINKFAPFLTHFSKRLSNLRPDSLHLATFLPDWTSDLKPKFDRKSADADLRDDHDDEIWTLFSNFATAFGRKFGTTILAVSVFLNVVLAYAFCVMAMA